MISVREIKTPAFELKLDIGASIFSLQAWDCITVTVTSRYPPKPLEVSGVGSNYCEKHQCVILQVQCLTLLYSI